MSFFARLLGREQNGYGKGLLANSSNSNKRQQPCSPPSGSFAPEFSAGRPVAAPVPVKLAQPGSALQQQQPQQRSSIESDEDDCAIRVPGSIGCASDRNRSNSLARRRAAIDISPRAVQRLTDKVALLDAGHLEADGGGVTRTRVEALYTDMQLIHRGRSSMVYRAREVRSGRRVILKAYDASSLSSSSRRQALERHILTLRAAQAAGGPASTEQLVALERVVENCDGTYLVVQACNGGTLIEAIANSGGKLPERQVALKVAVPMLAALRQLHRTGFVHRDVKPEHLMIHNGCLKLGDFGSAGCASLSAAVLASSLQKQAAGSSSNTAAAGAATAAGPGGKQQQQQQVAGVGPQQQQQHLDGSDHQQLDQQQLLAQLQAEQLVQQLQDHMQTDCSTDGQAMSSACCPLQQQQQQQEQHREQQSHTHIQRFGLAADELSGALSPGVSGRASVQAVRDAMNFRIGSIEYMAPEMLDKPTAAEVFHLVIAQGIDEDDLPKYDEKVDVWSAGVVLYEALSGLQPFLADSATDMHAVIRKKLDKRLDSHPAGEPQQQQQQQQPSQLQSQFQQQAQQQQSRRRSGSSSHWGMLRQQQELPAFIARLQVSPEAKDFLAACLTWDPRQRPSAADLLAHPWLQRMQDEAAVVAASRASSRRISLQQSMQRAASRASDAADGQQRSGGAAVDISDSQLLQPAGAAGAAASEASEQQQQPSLVDPIVADMLHSTVHPDVVGYARTASLDLSAMGLERSQTSEQLEVGARNVLRTHTQRLQARPLQAHVHAA